MFRTLEWLNLRDDGPAPSGSSASRCIKPTGIPEGMATFLRQGAAVRSEADQVHMARSFADAPAFLI
jgi:hypothetical protein